MTGTARTQPAVDALKRFLGDTKNVVPYSKPPKNTHSPIFTMALARHIRHAFSEIGVPVDQHQQNGLYGVHQLRIEDGGTLYRIIVAPADAPISIGKDHADWHFNKPIDGEPK